MDVPIRARMMSHGGQVSISYRWMASTFGFQTSASSTTNATPGPQSSVWRSLHLTIEVHMPPRRPERDFHDIERPGLESEASAVVGAVVVALILGLRRSCFSDRHRACRCAHDLWIHGPTVALPRAGDASRGRLS